MNTIEALLAIIIILVAVGTLIQTPQHELKHFETIDEEYITQLGESRNNTHYLYRRWYFDE